MYALGIDLGTTYTAAAVWRDGRAEIVSLGDRTAAIPSVVLLRSDETFLTGESANRRGVTEPNRVAREFKRRIGDTTPIMLAGTPHSAESLMSRLLRAVVAEVVKREGGPPARVCVSHPANWGPYKIDLLGQAVRMADLPQVLFTTEPDAAATHYAQEQRLGVGAIVAVYDLGGGTFDAAVLRRTAGGFTILGKPEGIERLGGIDFDAAVFNHVRTALGGKLDELDEDDPAAVAAVARLREECVQAKEALSSDTDTTIPVLLPTVTTDVRLTRGEFESMVRPALHGSIEALRRAVRSAGCTPEQLHSVLLVGGSSRMPIVGQLVSAELGRPVAVDTHPKHAVALGAAWRAGLAAGGRPNTPPPPAVPTVAAPVVGVGGPVRQAAPTRSGRPSGQKPASANETVVSRVAGERTGQRPAATPVAPVGPPPAGKTDRRKRLMALGVAGAVVALLAGGGVALAIINGGDDGGGGRSAASSPSTTVPTTANSLLPPDEQCTDAIMSNPRWVCLTAAVVADGRLTIQYVSDGGAMSIDGGPHLHIYGGDGANPPDRIMGHQVPENEQGDWYVEDRRPSVVDVTDQRYVRSIGDAPKVCARVATADHVLVKAADGSYRTGNCVPVTRSAVTTTEAPPPPPRTNRPHQTHTPTTTESTPSSTEPSTTPPTEDSEPDAPSSAPVP